MKLIHHYYSYDRYSCPNSEWKYKTTKKKEEINLPLGCVAYIVRSVVPLFQHFFSNDRLPIELHYKNFLNDDLTSRLGEEKEACEKLIFCGRRRRKDYYILCAFNQDLFDEAKSLLEKITDSEILIIKECKDTETFDDPQRNLSFFAKDRIEEYRRQ